MNEAEDPKAVESLVLQVTFQLALQRWCLVGTVFQPLLLGVVNYENEHIDHNFFFLMEWL